MIRALVLALSLAPPALAATQDEVLQATVLPGWQAQDGSRMAALRLKLAPAWKTYWRAPGDAGIPPSFDWSGSENLGSVRYLWPRPVVFHTNGMQTIGYHDELVLPLQITPRDPSQPVVLRGRVDLGICNEICMPASLEVQARLEGAGAPDAAIRGALAARPSTAREAGLSAIACSVSPSANGLRITAQMAMPRLGGDETVVFEAGPDIWVDEAQTTRTGGHLVAEADMVADSRAPFALDRSNLVVTVIAPDRAVEIRGCPAP
ncbi:MAG: protein-disulfide reductase DsbD family protein [Paracoccaceae bacterium]